MSPAARSHVRTALFVDFDNVYSNLCDIDPAAGEAFATEPERWLRWMQEDMGQVVPDAPEGTSREVLVRACYLNPVLFGKFRPFFTRSAFRVVDCPPLTSRGKNSADIYMVLDIVDTLAHSTYFDEFILLSADADFTPVMLRLRAHDRRTVLLASGPSATALQSACDMVLPADVFLTEALGVNPNRAAGPAVPTSWPGQARSRAVTAAPALSPGGAVALDGGPDATRLRDQMRTELISIVAAAAAPVPMAAAAQRIRDRLGPAVLESSWGGYSGFGKFAESVTSDTLQVSGPHPPGYLIDPQRHEPLVAEESRVPLPESVADLAHRVGRIVGVPQLTPDAYRVLFEELARLSAAAPVTGSQTVVEQRVRDACQERGARVSRPAVHFVLQGFYFAGVNWRETGRQSRELADAFADNVLRLCINSRMELTGEEKDALHSWITGSAG